MSIDVHTLLEMIGFFGEVFNEEDLMAVQA